MPVWQEPRPKGIWGTTHQYKVVTVQISVVVSSCYSKAASTLRSVVVAQRKTGLDFYFASGHTSSEPVPGLLAVASRRSSVTMGLVRVLVRILVVLLHQRRVVPAVLRAWGQTVAIFPRPFVVVVFISRHQAAAFDRWKICCCVVAIPISLGLCTRGNTGCVLCLVLSWTETYPCIIHG